MHLNLHLHLHLNPFLSAQAETWPKPTCPQSGLTNGHPSSPLCSRPQTSPLLIFCVIDSPNYNFHYLLFQISHSSISDSLHISQSEAAPPASFSFSSPHRENTPVVMRLSGGLFFFANREISPLLLSLRISIPSTVVKPFLIFDFLFFFLVLYFFILVCLEYASPAKDRLELPCIYFCYRFTYIVDTGSSSYVVNCY